MRKNPSKVEKALFVASHLKEETNGAKKLQACLQAMSKRK